MTQRIAIAVGTAIAILAVTERGDAGEAFVTKVRGNILTVDRGAEADLEVGMAATVVRPPEEAVIHPITGENLGAPEIELGGGDIAKVSAKAASIRLMVTPLLPVRPGDIVRYITVEEQMVMEQEQSTQTAEKAAQERNKIRGEAGRLAKNIKNIQATIRGLERSIKALDRFDKDVVQPQFSSINRDMLAIKEELGELRETVSLMGSIPIEGIEEGQAEFTDDELEKLKALIEEEITRLKGQMSVLPSVPVEMPVPVEIPIEEIVEEEPPFFLRAWFLGVLAVLGIAGIGIFLYFKMEEGDDGEDSEEDEDDDELEDEDDDFDIEEDEEDDIVVEERS